MKQTKKEPKGNLPVWLLDLLVRWCNGVQLAAVEGSGVGSRPWWTPRRGLCLSAGFLRVAVQRAPSW